MEVEFDEFKSKTNLIKHGVAFGEAASSLLDENALVREDVLSSGESRWILLGMSAQGRLLVVIYSLRGDTPRLISARRATRKETKRYA